MKKVFVAFCFLLAMSISFQAFAENKAGINKLGGIIGVPIGLSFSHNFTTLDQIDLTVGLFPGLLGHNYGRYFGGDIALGYLRTVAQPNVNGAVCPFEIGGGVSFTGGVFSRWVSFLTVYFDMRWEIFFSSTPKFNMFLDFSPGIGFYLGKDFYPYYAPRAGIGFRAVL